MDWNSLLKKAYKFAALNSGDPRTQNSALIINKMGETIIGAINSFPAGIKELTERWQNRDLKCKYVQHAERKAIYLAARCGIKIDGLIMVTPWVPCTECAKAIIDTGIKLLATHKQALDRSPDFWKNDIEFALSLLKEAGVEVILYDGQIGNVQIRFNGEIWEP